MRWVVESDIADCLGAIPHDKVDASGRERGYDQGALRVLRVMRRAGVMRDGRVRRPVTGAAAQELITRRFLRSQSYPAGTYGASPSAQHSADVEAVKSRERRRWRLATRRRPFTPVDHEEVPLTVGEHDAQVAAQPAVEHVPRRGPTPTSTISTSATSTLTPPITRSRACG